MLQEERLRRIRERVEEASFCSLAELCETFGISRATARRDLQALAEANRVRLLRGGAASVADGTSYDPPYKLKQSLHREEKARIAVEAARLVHEGETVLLDSGTTALAIAERLRSARDVTVATNDVRIAAALSDAPGVAVTVIGGSLRKGYYATLGYFAELALEQLRADVAFLGVDAIDAERGLMVSNAEEMPVKKRFLAAAKRTVIVCDHTKFETASFLRLCPLADADLILTGRELDEALLPKYAEAGARIRLV